MQSKAASVYPELQREIKATQNGTCVLPDIGVKNYNLVLPVAAESL
jgi:hypothetical protein